MAAVVPDVSQSSLTVVTVGLPSPPGKTQLTQQIVEGQPITVCTACKDCSKFIAVMDDGGTTNCDGYVEDDEFSPPYKYPLIPHGGTVEYRQNNKCKTDQNSATTLTVYRKCGSGPAEVAFLIRFWCEGGCP